MVPFDEQSPFITSGIRIGTPAITTRGLNEAHMIQIVEFIDKVILNFEDEKVLAEIADQVNEMMADFPIFSK
jgi:glycine hydroxymethyltransferase